MYIDISICCPIFCLYLCVLHRTDLYKSTIVNIFFGNVSDMINSNFYYMKSHRNHSWYLRWTREVERELEARAQLCYTSWGCGNSILYQHQRLALILIDYEIKSKISSSQLITSVGRSINIYIYALPKESSNKMKLWKIAWSKQECTNKAFVTYLEENPWT